MYSLCLTNGEADLLKIPLLAGCASVIRFDDGLSINLALGIHVHDPEVAKTGVNVRSGDSR